MMKKLTLRQLLTVATMLFGLFFGAGNLIFPAAVGQMAGRDLWWASAGLLITGVGLPLLGVAALGISRKEGLFALSSRLGRGYGFFFTCVLYLTIGPFFAIPRCATVSYTVGIERLLPQGGSAALVIFSLVFFGAVLFFSLRPGEILTWVGKVLTPLFLCFLAVLVVRALTAPLGDVSLVEPSSSYAANAFTAGVLEGYNTMDALASLAFGIIVVNAIRSLGVEEPGGQEHRTGRTVQFPVHGADLCAGHCDGRPEPGRVPGFGQRRRGPGPDCRALLRRRGCPDPGRHRHPGLPENGGGPDHQLQRNFCAAVPCRTFLPGVGHRVLCGFLPDCQPGPERHPGLLHPGAHVPVPLVHCADPAHPGRRALRQ